MNHWNLKKMAADIQLVITDMDGTLLDSNKQITNRTHETIRKLESQSIDFTICTGRIPTMIEYYTKSLELKIPLVAANGAVVWDPIEKKTLYDAPIDSDQAEALMDFCCFHGMDYSALTLEASYFAKNSIRIERFHEYNKIAERNNEKPMRLEYLDKDHSFLRKKKIYKMLVYEIVPGQQKAARDFMKTLPGLLSTSSDTGLLDISSAGINKGTGLLELIRILGLEQKNVCAFGDFYNDVSLMKTAGLPIAMANGCEMIKDLAAYVTAGNDQEGVADAIEKLLL